MVIQNIQERAQLIRDLEQEITVLVSLGVDEQEVKYIRYLKTKKTMESD